MAGIRSWALWGLALGMAVPALIAQTTENSGSPPHQIQLAFGYSYMRANASPGQCGCFNLSGGNAEVAVRAWRGFSVVADLTGELAGTSNIPGQTLALVFVTAGPRFTYQRHRDSRYAPFVQGLTGVVHGFDAPFPNAAFSVNGAANSLAVFAGGGLDIAINHYLAIRPIQADYAFSQLPNNVNAHQNLFRYAAGVVFHSR